MERIIVLGIGNLLMMDDGIGIYVVEELAKQERLSKVHYVVGESDIDYCLEKIEEATFVIIIDAVISGKQPGEISVYPLEEISEQTGLNISPHNLHLFHVLYKQSVHGYLIGIEPYKIGFQIGLSQPLQEQMKWIVAEVGKKVEKLIER